MTANPAAGESLLRQILLGLAGLTPAFRPDPIAVLDKLRHVKRPLVDRVFIGLGGLSESFVPLQSLDKAKVYKILETATRRGAISGVDMSRTQYYGLDLSGVELTDSDFMFSDIPGLILKGGRTTGCRFSEAFIMRADFREAYISLTLFNEARLVHADLSAATVTRSTFEAAELESANLREAEFYLCSFRSANMRDTNNSHALFRQCNLEGANLMGADLEAADFSGSSLDGSVLTAANLKSADFRETQMLLPSLQDADDVAWDANTEWGSADVLNYVLDHSVHMSDSDWVLNPSRQTFSDISASKDPVLL